MTRHAYLPTLIITDKGSVFVSQVIHEVTGILGINIKLGTTKHAQSIGVLERAHFALLLFSFSTLMRPFAVLIALVRNSVFSINCEIDNNCTPVKWNQSNASQSFSSGKLSLETIRGSKRWRTSNI